MKLVLAWIVTDPTPESVLEDICYSCPVSQLGNLIIGGGPGTWAREHATIYTTAKEAKADALARLSRRTYPVTRSDGKVVNVTVPED